MEVAVALPVHRTFTYLDPRGAEPLPVGAQVVVPFGGRAVTGFVVGHPAGGAAGLKHIEAVLGAEPALDADMVAFCRWSAAYYIAPLGEVLRAALPQGELAKAVRRVRLTEVGSVRARAVPPPMLPGTGHGSTGPGASTGLLEVLRAAGGEITLRVLAQRFPGASRQLPALLARGLVEVGDEVRDRRAPPTASYAIALPLADDATTRPTLPSRAHALRAVWEKVLASPGGLARAALSPRERSRLPELAARRLLRIERRPIRPDGHTEGAASSDGPSPLETPPVATEAQAAALSALRAAAPAGFAAFVLHGVTGSGKTEVYLRIIEDARAAGRGALVLVPEIALTPQLAGRFRARFGDSVAVLHSGLPPAARLHAWRRLRDGELRIAVGARSALFAPVRSLGVVVVDEEHDGSFKQEEGFRYNARDLAVVRAQRAGALVILGSATPSLESMHNVALGRFRILRLPERATPRPLPHVEVVDLRRTPPGPDGLFSPPLAEAVAAALAAGQQVILFLNRRGFSTVVLCRACGHVVRCGSCAVAVTYHRGRDRLVCHYCGRVEMVPARCPGCRQEKLDRLGMGTERVEAVVRQRFPGARVARLDRDTAGASSLPAGASPEPFDAPPPLLGGALERILRAMRRGEIDILVGTQMIAKGHDFPGVTVVGVLAPDQGLHLPDFRAAERSFQLLEQVAGRAGRGEHPGRVIIQTYTPEHPAVVAVQKHDYDGFASGELALRREAGYPPQARMVALRIDGPDAAAVRAAAEDVARAVAAAVREAKPMRVLGPAEAPIARLRGRARWQVWLAGADRSTLAAAARAGAAVALPRGVRLTVDVDPQSVL